MLRARHYAELTLATVLATQLLYGLSRLVVAVRRYPPPPDDLEAFIAHVPDPPMASSKPKAKPRPRAPGRRGGTSFRVAMHGHRELDRQAWERAQRPKA